MKKRRYDDQITFPVELPLGVALRCMADLRGVSLATLVRDVVMDGLKSDPELTAMVERFSTLTPNDLIRERESILNQTGWKTLTNKLMEEKVNA